MWGMWGVAFPVVQTKCEDEDEEDLFALVFCTRCACHYMTKDGSCPKHGELKDGIPVNRSI